MMLPSVAVRLPNLGSPELIILAVLVHSHPGADFDCNIVYGVGITIVGFTFMVGLMNY